MVIYMTNSPSPLSHGSAPHQAWWCSQHHTPDYKRKTAIHLKAKVSKSLGDVLNFKICLSLKTSCNKSSLVVQPAPHTWLQLTRERVVFHWRYLVKNQDVITKIMTKVLCFQSLREELPPLFWLSITSTGMPLHWVSPRNVPEACFYILTFLSFSTFTFFIMVIITSTGIPLHWVSPRNVPEACFYILPFTFFW